MPTLTKCTVTEANSAVLLRNFFSLSLCNDSTSCKPRNILISWITALSDTKNFYKQPKLSGYLALQVQISCALLFLIKTIWLATKWLQYLMSVPWPLSYDAWKCIFLPALNDICLQLIYYYYYYYHYYY